MKSFLPVGRKINRAGRTAAATRTTPRQNPQGGMHVGVVSNSTKLTSAQITALRRAFEEITRSYPGRLILHHGCGVGADEAAHALVRGIGGWQIYGHPLVGSLRAPLSAPTSVMNQLSAVHQAKKRSERDADIINVCTLILVVPPYEQELTVALRVAASAGRQVMYVNAVKPIPVQTKGSARRSRGTGTGMRPLVPGQSGRPDSAIPREWYKDAAATLGARVEAHGVKVVLKVGGKVVDQFREPRGWKKAAEEAEEFNRNIARHKLNPPELQAEEWR